MFRLSKIADYGIIILAHLAQHAGQELDGAPRSLNARELAEHVDLPLPIVSKVLKTLTRAGVLESQRGAKGGYSLAHRPEDLSVADMITALDGPLALTQCSLGPAVCDLEESCAVKSPWLVINRVVHNALASVTLADLTSPAFATQHAPLAGLVHVAEGAALPMASAAGGSRTGAAAGSRIAAGASRNTDGPHSPTSVMADAGTDEVH
jgi:FeS assembly SUF system regulator